MKKLTGAIFGLLMLALWLPKVANVAGVDWLGRVSALGGAQRETTEHNSSAMGGSPHAFGAFQGLGVVPITPMFGLQFSGGVGSGGNGARMDFQAGPLFGWGNGKAGVFWGTQVHRWANGNTESGSAQWRIGWQNWIRPAVSFYDLIPNTNIDIWYSQPVGGIQNTTRNSGDEPFKKLVALSEGRIAVNWFPPFIMKDNVEITLGAQVTGASGAGNRVSASVPIGAGPVAGMALMPWQNLEVQLFKAQIDNRNRYRVSSGFQYYFNKGNATLLQLRRMYLEPTNIPGMVSTDGPGA
jgi:hypothetical protein